MKKPVLGTLLTFVLILGGGYVALVALLYLVQDRMLYFPTRHLPATPAHRGLPFETVTLPTSDGERLHAWWIPAEPERAVLLFCHGNAGNVAGRLESVEIFHRLGLSVLLFDYRGYGQSTGTPSEAGLYHDAEAAWRYLTRTRRVAPGRIVLFGRSLGGAVATYLAAQQPAGALVIESTFTSVPDAAAVHYPWLPVRRLARSRFDTLDRIAGVKSPVLVLHSRYDEIIPFAHGQRLFEAAPPDKAFVELNGGHNDGFLVTGRRYDEALDAFLSKYLGR